jgi:subtilisin-like proprotein convertase family protein
MLNIFLKERSKDKSPNGFLSWPFTSLQFWGENPVGLWRLQISTKFNMTSKHFKTFKINKGRNLKGNYFFFFKLN